MVPTGADEVEEGAAPPLDADMATLELLFREQFPRLARIAGLVLGDFAAGEDIAQEAFARLLVRRRSVSNPAGYLTATVMNLSRSRLRRALVVGRHPPDPPVVLRDLAIRVDGYSTGVPSCCPDIHTTVRWTWHPASARYLEITSEPTHTTLPPG